jgi:hypothetical protein
MCDDASLPGTGSREDQERAVDVKYRFALFRIE